MDRENGSISIHTENIFPILKKWLYSDNDIFVRELVSNGCDAINKLKRLSSIGEAKIPDDTKYEVKVSLNKTNNTLKFTDNGIGMTAEEVKKYINQVAFSGAEEFITKYKDKMDEANQIIGHFGLGFYSAFMVSSKVEIQTLSFIEGAEAVKWSCDGGTDYEIETSEKNTRGTEITLFLTEDSKEFADEFRLRSIIKKHCSFLPIEIFLENEEVKPEEGAIIEPLNDTQPLWTKTPSECTDEEYIAFYKKVFNDFNEPLFWIHLNVDYPFNLKGILYFPRLMHELDASEGEVKLYNNQVFVADNIKEVIPEYLLLLKGVIDCSDLPLNVSRSFLQNDRNVSKISKHITKKVADKLTGLCKNERETYNGFWNDISPFVKYGCMRDEDFFDQVKDAITYRTINEEYVTLKEYLEKNKEKHENKVFYSNDELQQAQYIRMFKENDLDAVILDASIDNYFVNFIETKEEGVTFSRIDSDISDTMKDLGEDSDEKKNTIQELFKNALGIDKVKIKVQNLKSGDLAAIILLDEHSRRIQELNELSKMMGEKGMPNMFPKEESLVLNTKNELIQAVYELSSDETKKETTDMLCKHIYDIALLSHKQLSSDQMAEFIKRNNEILLKLAK